MHESEDDHARAHCCEIPEVPGYKDDPESSRWGGGREREYDRIQISRNPMCNEASTRNARSWKRTGESLQVSKEIVHPESIT